MGSTTLSEALSPWSDRIPDDFDPERSLEALEEVARRNRDALMARNAARAVELSGIPAPYRGADTPEGRAALARAKDGRGTYFEGPCGVLKTTSACCALRLWIEGGGTGAFWQTARLLQAARDSMAAKGPERGPMGLLEGTGLLVIDDIGAERATDWAVERLTALLDARCSEGRPTIFTSNLTVRNLADQWGGWPGVRLMSRILGSCDMVHMGGPDMRLANKRREM